MARDFNLFFMATCAILALFIWLPLRQFGECCSYDDIIQRQMSSESLYHSKFNPTASAYKLAGIRYKKPAVLVIGSFRVMQFREEFFAKHFYNAGGVASGVYQLDDFVDRMMLVHRPSVVLIGVDLWWFNPRHPYAAPDFVATQNAPSKNMLGKARALFNRVLLPRPARRMGLSSMDNDAGFGMDGSYYYNLSSVNTKDSKFRDTLDRLKNGGAAFEKSHDYRNENLAVFIKSVNKLKASGIQVILFYPPFAPSVAKVINQNPEYQYINKVKTALKNQFEVFDYTDPVKFDSNECEFIDGFHGGDVTYARMLADMAKHNPEIKFILATNISATIARYEGRARISNQYRQKPEIDFLELGCER
jgi:hypothetical protein